MILCKGITEHCMMGKIKKIVTLPFKMRLLVVLTNNYCDFNQTKIKAYFIEIERNVVTCGFFEFFENSFKCITK